MRTRSRGPASPPPAPKPVKRRASTSAAPTSILRQPKDLPAATTSSRNREENATRDIAQIEESASLTPRRAKRVRFSEPGPSLTLSPSRSPDPDSGCFPGQHSTGLTPALHRTHLFTPRSSRHASFPLSPSLRRAQQAIHLSGSDHVVQFAQLTAHVDPRTKRRLRRSHVSETQIVLVSPQEKARRCEIASLKATEAMQEARIAELSWELESQRQLGIAVGTEEEQRIAALEAELRDLRERLERVATEDERRRVLEWAHEDGSETEVWSSFNPSTDAGFSPSLGINGAHGDGDDVCRRISFGDAVEFQSGQDEPTIDVGVQVAMEDDSHAAEIQLFERAVARLTSEANDARQELDRILGELKRLGLVHEDMPACDVGEGLARLFRTARLELEYALPGETASGFEDGRLLSVLVNHVRNLKEKMTERSKATDQAEQRECAMRRQFDGTLERVQHLESRLTVIDAQRGELRELLKAKNELVQDLELAGDARRVLLKQKQDSLDDLQKKMESVVDETEHEREKVEQAEASAVKLRAALDSYRSEILSLEALVTSMDDDACQLKERVEEQDKIIAALKRSEVEKPEMLGHRQQDKEDSAKRVAQLEQQVADAQRVIAESSERLDREVKKHMHTRATLDELQDEIDRANGKASKSKRDSGAMCW